MDRADRIRPCEVCVLDDALRSGSTTVDREGGRYLGIPPEATLAGDAPQFRGARMQLTGLARCQETLSTAQRSHIWASLSVRSLTAKRRYWPGRRWRRRDAQLRLSSAL